MAVARLSGAVERLAAGGTPRDLAVEELRAISDQPALLGDVLGAILHRVESEHSYLAAAAELLRAAGADEQAAVAKLGWLRERDERREGGFTL
jgi:hypothetical protein